MANLPDKDQLLKIAEHLKPFIHRTPVFTSSSLNKLAGCRLYFKCESFQKTGSFKLRGAMNAILNLRNDAVEKGVVTHSSGNFAAALAYAASRIGAKAAIVMPENVIPSKRDAVLSYGANIIYSGNNPLDREKKCEQVISETGSSFIHPSNDINVILGHSSCAIELISDSETLDAVIAPVGGGGLISGIALGFKHFSPRTQIIGGEPLNADDAYQSLKAGKIIPQIDPKTIADGLRTSLGDVTFPIIKDHLSEIIRVSEDDIINAMKLIWERLKIVAEPSGAVAFAALLNNSSVFNNKKIGIIISGGNIDTSALSF